MQPYANAPLLVSFSGSDAGQWRVLSMRPIKGEPLPSVSRLWIGEGPTSPPLAAIWTLRGTTSNARYTTTSERAAMQVTQEGLGRSTATRAALIPISKSPEWWNMAQDARRAIFEEDSRHTAIGMEYLPAIARRLHHGRDLGEPFDFLTWFEFAPEAELAFEQLVARLRDTKEWGYVTREIDIRLERQS